MLVGHIREGEKGRDNTTLEFDIIPRHITLPLGGFYDVQEAVAFVKATDGSVVGDATDGVMVVWGDTDPITAVFAAAKEAIWP